MNRAYFRAPTRMRSVVFVSVLWMLGTAALVPQPVSAAQDPATAGEHRAMLQTYCFTCHSTAVKMGGLALEGLDLESPAAHAEIWEQAVRKLRGRLMPPPGNPQPEQADIDAFVGWMEDTLDREATGPKAGHVPIQRLNRTEYAASVKALVGVEVDSTQLLPQDVQAGGFDNVAAVLGLSPAFLDQYFTAARHVASLAIGSPKLANVRYAVSDYESTKLPLPPGARGGMRFRHSFPADGRYSINILDLGLGVYNTPLENESTLVIMIDGRIVFREPVGGPDDLALADLRGPAGHAEIMARFSEIPVEVRAGVRDVVVTFVDRSHVESDENFSDGFAGIGDLGFGAGNDRMPQLNDGVQIVGPFNPTGVSETTSRRLIFVCDPETVGEAPCARRIAENLARRAFRRPVTADDVDSLMPFYEIGRENGGSFDFGIEQIVTAVLSSPEFLYRSIRGVGSVVAGSDPAPLDVPLTDLELASRLSYFLWSAGPDEELLALAEAGELSRPGALDDQVRRMIDDPKASSLVTSFAMKWLNIADLDAVIPDPELFPEFSSRLRLDFATEAEEFLTSVLLGDRSVVDLLTADYTYLNDRLARHYDIEGVYGPQFRRVALEGQQRRGLLGKGAVLLRTSYGDRTSPVLRGAWVMDKIMGTPPSPPPPNVTTNLDQVPGEAPKTIRERLEQHRQQRTCMQCHGVIDPPGLPLENFDAIGRWRTTDRQADNVPIDVRTVLPNGVSIDGPIELRDELVRRPEMFVEALTERLLMYAVNRELEYFDMPQVRAIVREARDGDYTLAAIIRGIVGSDAFRRQGVPAATPEARAMPDGNDTAESAALD